jgi:hypothetical protein
MDLPKSFEAEIDDLHFGPAVCLGDLDADGAVGITDLLSLLWAWGTDGPADLDGSGAVAVGDLLALLGAWGPCP